MQPKLILPSHPTMKSNHFIKIILSHDSPSTTIRIRIPAKFTDKHGKELLDRVILKLPNADVWQVDLNKSRPREIWLQNGWSEFAHHYGLRFGHLLMFEYQASSIFGVTIFNASGSEILYPPPLTKTQVKLEDDDDQKPPNLNINNDEGECSRRHYQKKKKMEDGRKAVERAKLNFKSHKPFFMVYMHQSYVTRRARLTLPTHFTRQYLKNSKYLLQLANHGRPKTWEVVIHNVRLRGADWFHFVKENGVAVGDVCVFELIHKHQNLLAVTILKSDAP